MTSIPDTTEVEALRAELIEWKSVANRLWDVEKRALHLWDLGDRGRVRYILTGSWSTDATPTSALPAADTDQTGREDA